MSKFRTDADRVAELVSNRKEGWSLEQDFYLDPYIYDLDLERIWKKLWLFAGHSCEVKSPGDYFTFELAGDSVIVARQDDHSLRAFFNTCRHRGSRLICEEKGHAKSFVCPYHQWSYHRDGRLLNFGGTVEGLEKEAFSLPEAHVTETGGLVFICFAETPPDFAKAREAMEPQLKPHEQGSAKIAFSEDYVVKANWKLVWENNRECFHCRLGHPEYIKSNYDTASPNDREVQKEVEAIYENHRAEWERLGIGSEFRTGGVPFFPTPGVFWRSVRTVFRDGWVTQSMDGKPVSRPMGKFTEHNAGNLRVSTLPNLWNHANSDYSMTTRMIPLSAEETLMRVSWLVHPEAEEGKDYQLENLVAMWKVTGEQDWSLCERNHLGIRSSRYAPGPYSRQREYNVNHFVNWYLEHLKG